MNLFSFSIVNKFFDHLSLSLNLVMKDLEKQR